MPIKSKYFDAFKADLPNVDGKVFVITGTTSGTGFIAARTVAEKGGTAVLLNRPSNRAVDSLKRLKEAVPNGKFVPIECDLQDFSSVRKAIAEIRAKYNAIYCLSNNAGIMATPDEATVDGYDTQMQTNHLSHFLLTAELYPLLEAHAKKFGDARIVNHSSEGRNWTPNKGLERKYFEKNGGNLGGDSIGMMSGACFHRYFQTKLANAVFTYGLHDKLAANNSAVRVICAHPGGAETDLSRSNDYGCLSNFVMKYIMPWMIQSAEDGTMGLLKGMMATDAKSGVHYGPKGISGKAVPMPIKDYENDPKAIQMLFETSEAATGAKFEL